MGRFNKKKKNILERKLSAQLKFKKDGKLKQRKKVVKSYKRDKVNDDGRSIELTEDDRTIHTMERLMSIQTDKKRKLPSCFAQDGLDYILDVVDYSGDDKPFHLEQEEPSLSDDQIHSDVDSDDKSEMSNNSDNFDCDTIIDDNTFVEDAVTEMHDASNEDVISDDGVSVEDDVDDLDKSHVLTNSQNSLSNPNVITKYVSPACRQTSDEEKKKFENIKRQLKGLINRVSQANLQSICFEIESFYKLNSRALVTQTLSDVILVQFYTPDPIPERLITESAMVVAILCHSIGNEVVAYFLEAVAKKLHELLLEENCGRGKECNNVIQLICSLYQLKIIQKQLVLDIIQLLINSFAERHIELLVVVLKSTGFQLRKDDPISLKSIVEQVTLKSSCFQEEQNSRTKFMIDMLTAIKNNNVRKVLGYDVELINNRRKKVKLICSNQSDVFADVKFKDLVNADHQGRWWIVGSSWGGAPMLKTVKEDKTDPQVSSKLIQAAKKLRMNTDIRKKIFYAVMSSSDFVEAFGNINQLKLTGKQQREICHVIIECCQREKNFNPFYFHLINKFCHRDRQFVMTSQCSFWDRFKSLQSLTNKHSFNIAKLLSSLLLSEALPLSCLKTFEFAQIDKPGVAFLRQVLSNVAKDAKSVAQLDGIFLKLDSKKHAIVKNGLRLFIQHFMLKDSTYMKQNIDLETALSRMDQKLDSQRRSILGDP